MGIILHKWAKTVLKGKNESNTRVWTGKNLEVLKDWKSEGIHQQRREKLKKEYTRGLGMILKYEMNTKNKITAIEALAIIVFRHSFAIINWKMKK